MVVVNAGWREVMYSIHTVAEVGAEGWWWWWWWRCETVRVIPRGFS